MYYTKRCLRSEKSGNFVKIAYFSSILSICKLYFPLGARNTKNGSFTLPFSCQKYKIKSIFGVPSWTKYESYMIIIVSYYSEIIVFYDNIELIYLVKLSALSTNLTRLLLIFSSFRKIIIYYTS